jgi:hypothetical protein
LLRTPYESSIFVFFAFLLLQEGKVHKQWSQRSIPTTVKRGSSTIKNRWCVKLLDY